MPNWTTNTIQMEGIGNEDLFNVDENGERYFDFNKLIPQPKTKEECPPKYIDNGDCHLQHTEDDVWFNWYDWNVDHWGTKWNACDCDIFEDEVTFQTAWNCPMPIFDAVAERYKDRRIVVEWEDEDDWDTVHRKHYHFFEED